MARLSNCFFVGTLLVVAGVVVGVLPADKPAVHPLEQVRQNLQSKLDRNAAMEFDETPLDEVLEVLSHEHDLPLSVDSVSLDDMGLTPSDPITVHIRDMPLRFALRHALQPLDLDVIIRDEGVVIVSQEAAEAHVRPIVYSVSDLAERTHRETVSERLEALAELITTVVQPNSWGEVGGTGSVSFLETCGAMVISQNDRNHRRVAGVLEGLRRVMKQESSVGEASAYAVRMTLDDGWRDGIRAKLDKRAELELDELPLDEAVEFLRHEYELPILIDSASLDDLGLTTSDPISMRAKGISFRSVLGKMLRPMDLTFVLQDGVVMITSLERAERSLIPVAYPVGHLLRPGEGAVHSSNQGDPSAATDEPLDFDALIELLTSTIAPNSWSEVGGAGALVPWEHPPCLVCAQTDENHAKVQHLLTRLAQVRAESPMAPDSEAVASAMVLEAYTLQINAKTGDEVLRLLMDLVPEAKPNDASAVIQVIGGRLVVKNRRSVQRKVESTLRSLGFLPPVEMEGGGFGGGGGFFRVERAEPVR